LVNGEIRIEAKFCLRALALHLFVCGRGKLNKFAAEMVSTLEKSSELENGEMSIDYSAPERFCEVK